MARIALENGWIKAGWINIRWYVACLGIAGKVGVGLIVLALLFWMTAVLPQQQILQALQDKVEGMQLTQSDAIGSIVLDDDQALQLFYDFLPQNGAAPYWINILDQIAEENGVALNRSDYRLQLEKESRLLRYEIKFPISGTYPQIRAFIASILQAVPALALTNIDIKRETVALGQVEARLGMALYLRDD
ncbi:hypothetical protein Nstercoris_01273 [Nitrosomonas stercoris]|uniref:Transmembrane protein n=1 Tax=Nitrosomonas stercoris TaxID=1444684 RepID=A0A4Y1YMT9_9PROT|nr:hypothetical protein Nstercoris_01273 [Nitrosomonas stercoris]